MSVPGCDWCCYIWKIKLGFEGSSAESMGKSLKSSDSKQPLTMLGAPQRAGCRDSPAFSRVAFLDVCFFPFTVTKVYIPHFDSEFFLTTGKEH